MGNNHKKIRSSTETVRPTLDENIEPLFYPYAWNVDQLARALRKKKQFVYDNIRKIPHIRLGNELRFEPKEIVNWLRTLGPEIPKK